MSEHKVFLLALLDSCASSACSYVLQLGLQIEVEMNTHGTKLLKKLFINLFSFVFSQFFYTATTAITSYSKTLFIYYQFSFHIILFS